MTPSTRRWLTDLAALTGIALLVAVAAVVLRVAALADRYFPRPVEQPVTDTPEAVCGFRPFPGNGAYGHWTCERRRRHFGRHRFRNYTIGRLPRIWRVRRLWAAHQTDRRIRSISRGKPGFGYRRTLYPTKYEPTNG